jgi:hypothetical protein
MNVRLQLSPPEIGRRDHFWIGVALEFNANAAGRKFPYFVVGLGSFLLQCGWLWG